MLEMIMLLGTGLAAAGIAGMTGIGSQSGNTEMEPASGPAHDYQLGDDYKGGEGEDLLSQVRRMGGALDLSKFMPGSGGGAAAETAEPAAPAVAESTEYEMAAPAEVAVAESVEEETAAVDAVEEDGPVDFDALLGLMNKADQGGETDPEIDAEEDTLFAADGDAPGDETAVRAEAEIAVATEDLAAVAAYAPETEIEVAEEVAVAEDLPEDSDMDAEIPVITDFTAGAEQLLLMLPDGMADDPAIEVLPAGPDGLDAEVVLTDGQGSLTAVIVAGAYGSLSAGDVVLEREG